MNDTFSKLLSCFEQQKEEKRKFCTFKRDTFDNKNQNKKKYNRNSQYLAMSDRPEVVLLAPHAVLNEAVRGVENLQKIK